VTGFGEDYFLAKAQRRQVLKIRNSKQIQITRFWKHEIRSTKSETNSNDPKLKIPNKLSGLQVLDFPSLNLFDCRFVSNFDIRISDFDFTVESKR